MRLYQQCTKRLFATVTLVVSPSAWLLKEHKARGFFVQSRTAVLPNPVPPPQNHPHNKTTGAPLKLLYDGQLEAHKGAFWLIETLKAMPRQDFELHLVARGDKARLAQAQTLIDGDSRFKLHWLVTQAEIDEHYASAHLTIVPSLCYENSPGSIAKSFLAGTPALAVRLGGVPELIREGETGWLYTPGDAAEFLQKLDWCLDHPGDLLRAGLSASREFEDRTLERYVQALLKLAA
jgi:glycosyltransferase involved in cell wall biosynthesis